MEQKIEDPLDKIRDEQTINSSKIPETIQAGSTITIDPEPDAEEISLVCEGEENSAVLHTGESLPEPIEGAAGRPFETAGDLQTDNGGIFYQTEDGERLVMYKSNSFSDVFGDLADFGFVEQTSDRKWTFQLSPWYVSESDHTHPVFAETSQGSMQGVLQDAVGSNDIDDDVLTALVMPDYERVRDLCPWLSGWMDVVETLTASIDGCGAAGLLGEELRSVQFGEPPPHPRARQSTLSRATQTQDQPL